MSGIASILLGLGLAILAIRGGWWLGDNVPAVERFSDRISRWLCDCPACEARADERAIARGDR